MVDDRCEVGAVISMSEVVDSADEAYDMGKRDGYEEAVQDIDIATGGDGEFKGSTLDGETVDVPAMKARIISRCVQPAKEVGAVSDEMVERLATAVMRWATPHLKHIVSYNVLKEAIEEALEASRTPVVAAPVAWHCVGSGDGWAEDKITRDAETAADYAKRPHQWKVTALAPIESAPAAGVKALKRYTPWADQMLEDEHGHWVRFSDVVAPSSPDVELERLTKERDEALDRVEELERDADNVSAEFERELTGAVWALLRRLDADLSEGMDVGQAVEWLDLHIRELVTAREAAEARASSVEKALEAMVEEFGRFGGHSESASCECDACETVRRARTTLQSIRGGEDGH